jgi:deferrochelatase/peroxidase EfeB
VKLSRRHLLGAGGATVALTACSSGSSTTGAGARPAPAYLPFLGAHQTQVTSRSTPKGLVAAFNVVARDRSELASAMQALSAEVQHLMEGRAYPDDDPSYPAQFTGTLGNPPAPSDLSIVVGFGASLFDDRFALASRKPNELVEMPFFSNDRLDPALSHGDVLVSISADTEDAALFGLRQLMRKTRRSLTLRWMLDGFNRQDHTAGAGEADVRNLLGFKDGTANLAASDVDDMDRFVWVQADDGEPDWAVGGSYLVVRIVRMFVEFWDRVSIAEQEAIIGRHRVSGAPLGLERETDDPDFASDPDGQRIRFDSHIRLANPRVEASADSLMLRKGFSYSRGFDGAGRLDQGLCFVSYQRSLERGFVAVQQRLDGEPLEEYIQPVGGGYFFVPPGVATDGDWLGSGLLG